MRQIMITPTDVLALIDIQPTFMQGGELPVPDGDAVVPVANHLLQAHFAHAVATQDWHPAGHLSFASMHPGRAPYDEIDMPYGRQTLWPDHALQATPNAELHPDLLSPRIDLIVRKGFRREIDSYSAFTENDAATPTGLAGYLRERGLQRLFFTGLAYDFCVGFSALAAARLGFESLVVEDLSRAVNLPGTIEKTNADFAAASVQRILTTGIF